MDRSELKRQVIAEVDRLSEELIDLSCRIHANPELGFEEHKAVAWLGELLQNHGFAVQTGVAGLPTAFTASYAGQQAGPTIALLAEYDALAKLGHACGHNIMGTASTGAAIAVSKVISTLPGIVMVIGTPAEEGGGGKDIMVKNGVFRGIDAAMIVHPGTRTKVITKALASVTLDVNFIGKSAHAAAHPEEGVNALDAMILSYNNVNALRQHIRDDARIHGIITDGGEAPNIVPSYSAGRFYVRAADDVYLDALLAKVIDCFHAGARATGAILHFEVDKNRYAAMRNNLPLAEAFGANLTALGVPLTREVSDASIGSTDMGNVSQVVPSIHPIITIADESVATHSPEFAAAAVSDAGHRGMLNSARALAMTTIDLLVDADLLTRMRKEFARA